jgi:hypothetical protein
MVVFKLSRKLEDERLQVASLKSEIRNLHKVISSEVGEDVNIKKVNHLDCELDTYYLLLNQLVEGMNENSTGNWKGRSEQISILKVIHIFHKINRKCNIIYNLQDKVKELSTKLVSRSHADSTIDISSDKSGLSKLESIKRSDYEKACLEAEVIKLFHVVQ